MIRKHLMPLASLAAMAAACPAGLRSGVRNEGFDASKLEGLLKDVKSEMARVGDEVKRTAEDALKQSKNAGEVSADVKQKADELLTAQAKLGDAQQKLENKIEQLSTRNTDLEQKLSARRGSGGDQVKSLGQMVGEHDKTKAFAAAGGKGTVSVMDEDEFLVGAFLMAAKIYDRMDTEVLISSEDRDNFIKNMLTVRAEKRMALAVKRRQALVTGDFTTALAGIGG